MAVEKLPPFKGVVGVPKGGLKFAAALEMRKTPSYSLPLLIADDVLTTGSSMEELKESKLHYSDAIGVVVFARGQCPSWVIPLFQMGHERK